MKIVEIRTTWAVVGGSGRIVQEFDDLAAAQRWRDLVTGTTSPQSLATMVGGGLYLKELLPHEQSSRWAVRDAAGVTVEEFDSRASAEAWVAQD